MEQLNIEFGCGELARRKGYKTCDIRNLPGIDYVCKAWEIDQLVNENSVDKVFSRHFFEHLTFAQGKLLLQTWYKILKPSGKVDMILPDMNFHINNLIAGVDIEFQLGGIFGWQRDAIDDLWDVHKSGYSNESLKQAFENAGFIGYVRHKSPKQHLKISAYKPE